jgi:hypothetical protein
VVWQAFPAYEQGDVGRQTRKEATLHIMALADGKEVRLVTGTGNARDGFLRLRD